MRKVFGKVPEHVAFVPIDFNRETLDKLEDGGYDRSRKTLFIWEGVIAYLEPEAVDATLGWVSLNSAARCSIILDYIHPAAFSGKHPREEVKLSQWSHHFTGEGLIFGIDEDEVVEFMTRRGFTSVVNASAADFKRLYCTASIEIAPSQASIPLCTQPHLDTDSALDLCHLPGQAYFTIQIW